MDVDQENQMYSPPKPDKNFSLYRCCHPKSSSRCFACNASSDTPTSSRQPVEEFDFNRQDSGCDTNFIEIEQRTNAGQSTKQSKKSLFNRFDSDSQGFVEEEFMDLSCLETTDDISHLPSGFSKLVNATMRNETYEDRNKLPSRFPRRGLSFKEESPKRRYDASLNLSTPNQAKKYKYNYVDSSNCDSFIQEEIPNSISFNEASIKSALQRSSQDSNLIGDFSKPFCLPIIKTSKHQDLHSISPKTLVELIQGKYNDVASYKIIDCRYPYEYNGGHIRDAFNYYTQDLINTKLLENKTINTETTKRDILVFHCEFSSERGPKMSKFLRNIDRARNSNAYPALQWPEIYLLDGGYKNFYEQYSVLCEPNSYKPMLHPEHGHELKFFRSKSKSTKKSVYAVKSTNLNFD